MWYMVQLIDCFATSEMTIFHQQTKDTILESLNYSSLFYEKEMELDYAQSNTNSQSVNYLQTESTSATHLNMPSLQIENKTGHSMHHDETANHSPPRYMKSPTKLFGLPSFDMPGLELSSDTTVSNSRYRHIHLGHPPESQSEIKTPLKELGRERLPSSSTEVGAPSTPRKTIDSENIEKKESQLSLSNMLNIEMQCKTPLKHKTSPLKKKHILPTMPSPTSFTHTTRSPLLKSHAARRVRCK